LITNKLLIPLERLNRGTLGLPKIWAHNRHTVSAIKNSSRMLYETWLNTPKGVNF
jgi:hypothetical protein